MTGAAGVHLSLYGLPCFDGNAMWEPLMGLPERLSDAIHLKGTNEVRDKLGEFWTICSQFLWNFYWPCDAPACALSLEFMRQASPLRAPVSNEISSFFRPFGWRDRPDRADADPVPLL
eukprot:7827338-Alexandrium_andersonii.AAC.1